MKWAEGESMELEIIGHTGGVSYIFCGFWVFRRTWEVVYFWGWEVSIIFLRFLCVLRLVGEKCLVVSCS